MSGIQPTAIQHPGIEPPEAVRPSGKLLPWIIQRVAQPEIVEPVRRTATQVIVSGLDSIFAARKEAGWEDGSEVRSIQTTALVLIRLADLPVKLLSHTRWQQVQDSLDWLRDMHNNGCWHNDCLTMSLSVIALRSHARSVPGSALDFLQACCLPNGSFASSPGQNSDGDALRILALTVTAARALESFDSATEDFVTKQLQCAIPVAGDSNASRFGVSSEILDLPSGLASMTLLGKASQITAQSDGGSALERALVLRSLLRLRISRSWTVAARLREMQSRDGSWSASSSPENQPENQQENQVVVTATAVSALVMAESQPGLYFGSDRPLPRRY